MVLLSYGLETDACVNSHLLILPQDLRNYQYSVPVVDSLRIHMELGNSYIDIPKSKFNEVISQTLLSIRIVRKYSLVVDC